MKDLDGFSPARATARGLLGAQGRVHDVMTSVTKFGYPDVSISAERIRMVSADIGLIGGQWCCVRIDCHRVLGFTKNTHQDGWV